MERELQNHVQTLHMRNSSSKMLHHDDDDPHFKKDYIHKVHIVYATSKVNQLWFSSLQYVNVESITDAA